MTTRQPLQVSTEAGRVDARPTDPEASQCFVTLSGEGDHLIADRQDSALRLACRFEHGRGGV